MKTAPIAPPAMPAANPSQIECSRRRRRTRSRRRQHHALEADVEHAGALGDRLAERGEHQRHAGDEPARYERGQERLGEEPAHWARPPSEQRSAKRLLEPRGEVARAQCTAAAQVLDHRHEQQDQRNQHEQEVRGQVRLLRREVAAGREHGVEGDERDRRRARSAAPGRRTGSRCRRRPGSSWRGRSPTGPRMSAAAAMPTSTPLTRKLVTIRRGTLMPTCRRPAGSLRESAAGARTRCASARMDDARPRHQRDEHPDVDAGAGRSTAASCRTGSAASAGCSRVGSWNGPLIRMFATPIPMNDIISVVMISFVPYRALSTAGTSVHAAPAPPATRNSSVQGEPARHGPTSLGAEPGTSAAPSRNWPLYPRFQMFARKTTIRPGGDQQERRHQHRAVLPGAVLDAAFPHVRVEGDRVAPERRAAGCRPRPARAPRGTIERIDNVERRRATTGVPAAGRRRSGRVSGATVGQRGSVIGATPPCSRPSARRPARRRPGRSRRAHQPAAREDGDAVGRARAARRGPSR